MNTFLNSAGNSVLMRMVKAIQENKEFLSQVDGLIGDGDHGVNMNKGFTIFANRSERADLSFSEGLYSLGMVLMNEIGGSMGPIYGAIFTEMADALEDEENIGVKEMAVSLRAGLEGLYGLVDARVGDKTLVDTLAPAVDVLENAASKADSDFATVMEEMKAAAVAGRDATKELVAKFGRSSRLGERSRGVLDAGACSCCLLLCAMADGIMDLLQ